MLLVIYGLTLNVGDKARRYLESKGFKTIKKSISEESNTVYFEEIKVEVDKQYESLLPEIEKGIAKEYKDILKVGVKNEWAFKKNKEFKAE